MSELLYNSVVNLLKCPHCNNKLNTPVSVCGNGHATCKLCSQKMISCARCAGLFVNSHHTLINSILEATRKQQNYLDKLMQALECPVCYNQMRQSEICGNGHGVCKSCATLTQHCPLCRAPYIYNYSSLINSLLLLLRKKIPCKYWPECKTYCFYIELKEHEAHCKITLFSCQVEHCDWKGLASNIVHHVNIHHREVVLPKDNSFSFCRILGPKTHMFTTKDKAYWLLYHNTTDGLKLGLQSHDIHCNDTAILTIITEQQEIKLTSNIFNLRENLQTSVSFGNCLHIPNEVAAKFHRGQHCACNIKILKQNSGQKSYVHHIMAMFFVLNVIIFCTRAAK